MGDAQHAEGGNALSVSPLLQGLPSYAGRPLKHISLNTWAAYAIQTLADLGLPATKETIAVALFYLYPERWSLVGFPEYPDSERVNRALLQLRPKYRDWAYGDSQLGWTLNEAGRAEAERMTQLLANKHEYEERPPQPKPSRPRTRAIDQSLKDLESSKLYLLYSQGKGTTASRFDLWACFGSSGLTPPGAMESMRRNLVRQARALQRSDLVEFLDWMRKHFRQSFQGRGGE